MECRNKVWRKAISLTVALLFMINNISYATPIKSSTHYRSTLRARAATKSVVPGNIIEDFRTSSAGLNQRQLADIFEAQKDSNWQKLQQAQEALKAAFIDKYRKGWEEFIAQNSQFANPPIDINRPDAGYLDLTPELARAYNIGWDFEQDKPTGHMEEFWKKSDNSTAGVRSFYNPFYSWDPRFMYNDLMFALLVEAEAEFLKQVHNDIKDMLPKGEKNTKAFKDFISKFKSNLDTQDIEIIEKIYGMKLEDIVILLREYPVKLVGAEVRPQSGRFIELESRMLAANGVKVITPPREMKDNIPAYDSAAIFMFSFLTFKLGATGATHITPSHSSSYVKGRKALGPNGQQLLPDLYENYRSILKRIIKEQVCNDGKMNGSYRLRWSAVDDPNIMHTLTRQDTISLYRRILNITDDDIAMINEAAKKGHKITLNCLNGAAYNTIMPLLIELDINPDVFDVIWADENGFFNAGYIVTSDHDKQTGQVTYSVDHLGIDTTMAKVVNSIPYPELLQYMPLHRRVYEVDPDVDRFVVKQIMTDTPQTRALLDEFGIEYYTLGNGRILVAPSPNKVFLSLDIADYERMQQAGTWDNYNSIYLITYVSTRTWKEFSQAVGLKAIMSRVGFKNLNEAEQLVKDWYEQNGTVEEIRQRYASIIVQITVDNIIFKDQLGKIVEIGRFRTTEEGQQYALLLRTHSKEEESGGRVAGLDRPSFNILGQSAMSMPEKSAADSLISELIASSREYLSSEGKAPASTDGNYIIANFLKDRFQIYGLRSKIDTRFDILHGNQGKIAQLPTYGEQKHAFFMADANKMNFNNFFFSLGRAVRDGEITLEKAREILTAVLPAYEDTWTCMSSMTLTEEPIAGGKTRPEGVPMEFDNAQEGKPAPFVTEIDCRPSGTDPLKSKIYVDAERLSPEKKAELEISFNALTNYNLYAVLEYYGIRPSIPTPAVLNELNLKEFVIGQGPDMSKTSSAGIRPQDEARARDVLGQVGVDNILALLQQASRLTPEQASLVRENIFTRIGFDPGLNRMMLGWIPERIKELLDKPELLSRAVETAEDLKSSGKKSFIFTGIGGSGLGVGTIVDTYGQPDGAKIYTLTTPSRDQQYSVLEDLHQRYDGNIKQALEESVLFAISKSGSTAETREQLEFLEGLYKAYGMDPKDHIILITDPDVQNKPAEKNAFAQRIQQGYKWIPIQLDGNNDIGGRFTSPATMIALLPLALIDGQLIRPYLENAYDMVMLTGADDILLKQQFVTLGVFLDNISRTGSMRGRSFNKLTLLLPEELKAFAPWVVQLIHESLGKDGKGIEVLFGEELKPDMASDFIRQGRVFLRVNLADKAETEPVLWGAIQNVKVPSFEITVNGKEDLGGLQAGFQLTTAAIGYLSDIHFVIQPAVEKHKNATRDVMSAIREGEALRLPEITENSSIGSKTGRLSLYFDSLIKAGILSLDELRNEVYALGFDMNNPAAVYAALFKIISAKDRFEQVQLGLFGTMSEKTKHIFAEMRKNTFTDKSVPSLVATWPDDLHANEQDMADGLGREITFTIALYPTEAAEIPGGEAVNTKMQNQLAAPFIGLMNSKIEPKGMICGIAYEGTQEEAALALEGILKEADIILSKSSSSGYSTNEESRANARGSAGINLNNLSDYDAEKLLAETLLNYSPTGIIEVPRESQAVIVYSDALKESPALQDIIRNSAGDSRRFYLVNKEEHISTDAFLAGLNIDKDVFQRHIFHQNSMTAEQLALAIAAALHNNSIKQGRVFASTEEDLSAWSKQGIIEALVMLLKDRKFEVVSDYSQQHIEYIKTYQQALIAA